MAEPDDKDKLPGGAERTPGTTKRPYQKPAVRHERVFETRALVCGKVQTTQAQCKHNRKSS
ncbi:MAG TPA: hypothetical protein VMO17_17515 [Terriglobia bacterium]|nr:hypothetical protein [Terriglobia bacterium]